MLFQTIILFSELDRSMCVRRLQLASIPLLDPKHAAQERVSVFSFCLNASVSPLVSNVELCFVVGSAEALQGETRSRS